MSEDEKKDVIKASLQSMGLGGTPPLSAEQQRGVLPVMLALMATEHDSTGHMVVYKDQDGQSKKDKISLNSTMMTPPYICSLTQLVAEIMTDDQFCSLLPRCAQMIPMVAHYIGGDIPRGGFLSKVFNESDNGFAWQMNKAIASLLDAKVTVDGTNNAIGQRLHCSYERPFKGVAPMARAC